MLANGFCQRGSEDSQKAEIFFRTLLADRCQTAHQSAVFDKQTAVLADGFHHPEQGGGNGREIAVGFGFVDGAQLLFKLCEQRVRGLWQALAVGSLRKRA